MVSVSTESVSRGARVNGGPVSRRGACGEGGHIYGELIDGDISTNGVSKLRCALALALEPGTLEKVAVGLYGRQSNALLGELSGGGAIVRVAVKAVVVSAAPLGARCGDNA